MRTGHQNLAIAFRIALIGALAAGCSGSDGTNALTRTTAEPPGAHCASGGTKLEVGMDTNDSGALDDAEVDATGTTYVCNGAGTSSLIATTAEPAGANCPFGGTRIATGIDANGNGTLDPTEILATATTFVCNPSPSGSAPTSTGIAAAIQPGGVSTSATAPITVRFTLKDDRGFPVDINGRYSQNLPIQPRFALAYFTKDAATGIVSPLTTYTKSASTAAPAGQPTNYNPLGTAPGNGTLVENGMGAGDYTYTFPTTSTPNGPMAVAYDATKLADTHVVWIQVARQTDLVFQLNANTFSAVNLPYYFVPDGSTATPAPREIVSQAGCDGCHGKFKPETTTSALGVFHGGGRVAAGMCNVCHNPGRTTNPLADSASFIHRIHNGEQVATANLFHDIAVTYPQDIRKCDTCHGGAAQGTQSVTNPSALACKGCHDYVSFTDAAPAICQLDPARGTDGKPLPCNHIGRPQPDTACVTCHGPSGVFATSRYHTPVAPPDPGNAWLVPVGGNANTNASFVAAAGYVPSGAAVITYDVKSVDAVADVVTPSVKRPQITFKLKNGGTDVVFQTYAPTANPPVTEMMPGFVGSPSVYFAFAVPQDGQAKPSDFNASASGYLKKIWDGSAINAGAGTLTGPDASGYYTVTLTGVQIAPAATLLTGGVGYTYALTSTPPLVQTNVADYPWVPNVPADGKAQGGLSVPAPNVWKVATGYTARRAIVDNEKCKTCHGTLGVSPTFHAGQRNDGPTCSFCHNPNRTSSGWAAGSKYFIHAIHAGRKRIVPFTWHATEAGPGYDEVEFPGTLNTCTTCHLPNTFDFTNPTNLGAIPGMELTTVATGKYDTNPLTNSTYYTVSPYVVADNLKDYGVGFAYNAATNATTEAASTTLVLSPITGACAACHDTPTAISHMTSNGGQFYASRAQVLAPGAPQEQCLICHGPGRVAAIGVVHQH
jgi:OmcA/MtrC family decaheme c-type cytochrome